MNWWNAANVCKAHGLNLLTVEDINCYFDNHHKVTAGSGKTVYCCRQNQSCAKNDWGKADKTHLFSQEITDICKPYPAPFYPWLSSPHKGADDNTRSAYAVDCKRGFVGPITRTKTVADVLCY